MGCKECREDHAIDLCPKCRCGCNLVARTIHSDEAYCEKCKVELIAIDGGYIEKAPKSSTM